MCDIVYHTSASQGISAQIAIYKRLNRHVPIYIPTERIYTVYIIIAEEKYDTYIAADSSANMRRLLLL